MGNSSQLQDGLPSYSYQYPESEKDQRSIANSEENFKAGQFSILESPETKTPKAKRKSSEKPIKGILKAKRAAPGRSKRKNVKYKTPSVEAEVKTEVVQKEKRLERNRKSARESRKRKKEYIKRLENQV